MRALAPFALLIFFLPACISINTNGIRSNYKKLSAEERSTIVFAEDKEIQTVCTAKKSKIYAVTADQLKTCLRETDSSIVYIWSPNCHAESCISLGAAEKYCTDNGYRLFVVTEYYDMEQIAPQNNSNALLSVNHVHYGTDRCNRYVALFKKELLQGRKLKGDESFQRFLVFHKDQFIRTKKALL